MPAVLPLLRVYAGAGSDGGEEKERQKWPKGDATKSTGGHLLTEDQLDLEVAPRAERRACDDDRCHCHLGHAAVGRERACSRDQSQGAESSRGRGHEHKKGFISEGSRDAHLPRRSGGADSEVGEERANPSEACAHPRE